MIRLPRRRTCTACGVRGFRVAVVHGIPPVSMCRTCLKAFVSRFTSELADVMPLIDGPLAGATISEWQGAPPPELYVERGPGGSARGLPTPHVPLGAPRRDIGMYLLDVARRQYVWSGWLEPLDQAAEGTDGEVS